jgi:hypothetical protein
MACRKIDGNEMKSNPETRHRSDFLSVVVAASFLMAIMLVQGCSLSGGPETLPLSPSYPTLGKSQPSRYLVSSLVIVTGTFLEPALGDNDEGTHVYHTGYTVYDDQGQRLLYVRNHIGAGDSEATTLELNPGRYLILLDKPERQAPVFWVVVDPGKRTEVILPH